MWPCASLCRSRVTESHRLCASSIISGATGLSWTHGQSVPRDSDQRRVSEAVHVLARLTGGRHCLVSVCISHSLVWLNVALHVEHGLLIGRQPLGVCRPLRKGWALLPSGSLGGLRPAALGKHWQRCCRCRCQGCWTELTPPDLGLWES